MASKKKVIKRRKSRISGDLTIHFMPYSEIAHEDSMARIKKIMGPILENKIIILQGRLKPEEETKLIEHTMTLIGNLKGFQGIEIAVVSGEGDHKPLFENMRRNIAKILVGEQDAVTIIGPASVVKEIKRNPKKMELLLKKR